MTPWSYPSTLPFYLRSRTPHSVTVNFPFTLTHLPGHNCLFPVSKNDRADYNPVRNQSIALAHPEGPPCPHMASVRPHVGLPISSGVALSSADLVCWLWKNPQQSDPPRCNPSFNLSCEKGGNVEAKMKASVLEPLAVPSTTQHTVGAQ